MTNVFGRNGHRVQICASQPWVVNRPNRRFNV